MKKQNQKPRIEYKTPKHPKGGWYVIELTDGVETWRSSNFSTLESCKDRIEMRKELKDRILVRKEKQRPRAEIKPFYNKGNVIAKRIKKSYVKYATKFREYLALRATETNSERKQDFSITDIHQIFGLYPTALKRLVESGEIPKPNNGKNSKGKTVWRFNFEQLKNLAEYFESQILQENKTKLEKTK